MINSQDIRAQGWETGREGAPLCPGRCRRLPLLGLARPPAQKAAVPALAHPAAAARRGARSGCGPVAAAECGALGASAAPGHTQPSLSTPGPLRALVGSVPPRHSTPAHLPHPHRLCRPAAPPPSAPSRRGRASELVRSAQPSPSALDTAQPRQPCARHCLRCPLGVVGPAARHAGNCSPI